MRARVSTLVAVTALAACTSGSAPSTGSPTDSGPTDDARDADASDDVPSLGTGVWVFTSGPDGSEDIDAGAQRLGPCPAQPPLAGTACAQAALCSYGSSVSPSCRDWYECNNGWRQVSGAFAGCDPFTPACGVASPDALKRCPPDPPPHVMGCHFDDGTMCLCLSNRQWECAKPGGDAACPPFAPNQGTACTGGLRCFYGFQGPGMGCAKYDAAEAACVGGIWELARPPGCHP